MTKFPTWSVSSWVLVRRTLRASFVAVEWLHHGLDELESFPARNVCGCRPLEISVEFSEGRHAKNSETFIVEIIVVVSYFKCSLSDVLQLPFDLKYLGGISKIRVVFFDCIPRIFCSFEEVVVGSVVAGRGMSPLIYPTLPRPRITIMTDWDHCRKFFPSSRWYLSMTCVDEANGWYGGTLLGDQDESIEIYRHYAKLCRGPAMEPFQRDLERENHYADLLQMNTIDVVDDASVEAEMAEALREYDLIGADLGIFPVSCKSFTEDPSRLTRWIIGEDKLQKV
ncbi:putative U3 small nucleolar RNA-associated protein 7-like [Hibiscus syriacus]|uniref:U3 small nucleolar RNA-associated protein 7-like n=1 Tax=Hibiscus syriacus TaxID=106335 RepID=A0A6A3BH17_HIBSY|nr:putative U3 small nucleolar RNA-associated protein 7-like [Hibiscus syriacus]